MERVNFKEHQPEESGHYLVIWKTITSKEYPSICSDYDVLFWQGSWWAPVSNTQPVTYWMVLPKRPQHEE